MLELKPDHQHHPVAEPIEFIEKTVILIKHKIPRLIWKFDVIFQTHDGRDGWTKARTVRLQKLAIIRKPVQLLRRVELSTLWSPGRTSPCGSRCEMGKKYETALVRQNIHWQLCLCVSFFYSSVVSSSCICFVTPDNFIGWRCLGINPMPSRTRTWSKFRHIKLFSCIFYSLRNKFWKIGFKKSLNIKSMNCLRSLCRNGQDL